MVAAGIFVEKKSNKQSNLLMEALPFSKFLRCKITAQLTAVQSLKVGICKRYFY